MAFRISDTTIFNDAVRNTRLNRFALSELQSQVSSGKRVNSLADDPSDAARILNLRRISARVDQFDRNIDSATSKLEPVESALTSVTELLTRLRELAVSADQEEAQFDLIKAEVEERFAELVGISNSQGENGYLFGGFASDAEPFTTTGAFANGVVDILNPAVTYNGDFGVQEIQIAESSTIEASVPGAGVFRGDFDGNGATDAGRVNLFDLIRDLRNRLEDPNAAADPTFGANPGPLEVVDEIDSALEQILQVRGGIGAKLNRLDATRVQLDNLRITFEAERSAIEDLDLLSASAELVQRENTFQASLAVTARVIQPSLLDFLR